MPQWPEWGSYPPYSAEIVEWEGHKGPLVEVCGKYQVIQCEPCILHHIVPLPSQGALQRYYRAQFWQTDKVGYIERYERDRDWWALWYNTFLDIVMADARQRDTGILRYGESNCAVLDVGIGAGTFLDVAAERGWLTYGLEPNQALASRANAKGHMVSTHMIEAFAPSEAFDLVMLYEVLEHTRNPEDVLCRVHDLLDEGGYVCVVVPFDFSPLQLEARELCGVGSYWLVPSQHTYYFSPKTLQLLVRRCGFQIVDMLGTYPLECFMLIKNKIYVGNDRIGREIHQERMGREMHAFRSGQWQALLDNRRRNLSERSLYGVPVGREIVCVARKQ